MFGFLKSLFSEMQADAAAREAHLDRNQFQEGALPDAMPHEADCVVDPGTGTTWIRDDSIDHITMKAMDLHQVDTDDDAIADTTADTWRGLPDEPTMSALQANVDYQSDLAAVSSGVWMPDAPTSRSGYQAEYHPVSGERLDGGTFDYVSPSDSLVGHFIADVFPHYVHGTEYTAVDVSSGSDLSGVGPLDWEANAGGCLQGAYVGGDSDHGASGSYLDDIIP